jgi:hypothetical protein
MALNPIINGAQHITTTQVTLKATPTLIAPARATRRSVLLVNIGGTSTMYFGGQVVSSTQGSYLPAVDGASVSIPTIADVWATASTATPIVSVMEVFD